MPFTPLCAAKWNPLPPYPFLRVMHEGGKGLSLLFPTGGITPLGYRKGGFMVVVGWEAVSLGR